MCAAIGLNYGADAVKELAIQEWAGPARSTATVATDHAHRGRRRLAIFKVLQLDPGFPHHYMDVHYELVDEQTASSSWRTAAP